jgi:hypothetical protein
MRPNEEAEWFATTKKKQEEMVNKCDWLGRVLFTQPIVITGTIDTPEFNNLLGQYAARIENYRENHAALVGHIDAHTAAVAAKAVADVQAELSVERAALADAVRHVGNLKERASAPQQHAQAALRGCACQGFGQCKPGCDDPAPAQPIAGELPPLLDLIEGDWSRVEQQRIRNMLRTYGHQCRAAALEEAAKLIEQTQETHVINGPDGQTNERTVTPRNKHNLMGLAYAAAIRALSKTEG